MGDPDFGELEMTAYLKHAYVQYRKDRVRAMIGMIGLMQFKMQEDLWGGRYLYKSFMDEYRFGPSADLGAYLSYEIHEKVSVDLTVANGEGYKKLESDTALKYSIGTTINPYKGLDFRASYDHMGQDSAQQTLAFYLGYTKDKLAIGAEYNHQLNYKRINGHDRSGISLYGSYVMKKIRMFGRYDMLASPTLSSDTDPWNYDRDGQLVIAGCGIQARERLNSNPQLPGLDPGKCQVEQHIQLI